MSKVTVIILSFFVAFTNGISQQKTQKQYPIKGVILNSSSLEPVAFAHIYNESRKYGFIADHSGKFISNMKIGDTLAVVALGYLGEKHIVSQYDTAFFKILIEPRSYEIEEVTVEVPKNYDDFKKAFLKVNINRDEIIIEGLPRHNPYKTPYNLDTSIINSFGYYAKSPINAIYSKFSGEEASKRMVWYLKQQELKQPSVDKKYDRELVSRITGLKDFELTNFIGWCNFSFNYLYESTPLEIVEAIDRKFIQYKSCCFKNNPLDVDNYSEKL